MRMRREEVGMMEVRRELEGFSVIHRRGHLTALDPSVCLGGRTDQ